MTKCDESIKLEEIAEKTSKRFVLFHLTWYYLCPRFFKVF